MRFSSIHHELSPCISLVSCLLGAPTLACNAGAPGSSDSQHSLAGSSSGSETTAKEAATTEEVAAAEATTRGTTSTGASTGVSTGASTEMMATEGAGTTTGGRAMCCEAQAGPHCGDPALEACVCAGDPFCCEVQWDETCVGEIAKLGCGECPAPAGACCESGAGPGCLDEAIAACVCVTRPECCSGKWGPECVAAVDSLGCGVCEVKGACCVVHPGVGCTDGDVEACVCEVEPECCSGSWSEMCVALVEKNGCGQCGSGGCCEIQDGPGCGEPAVAICVCGQDPYCCEEQWDDICVGEVEEFGCGSCTGGGSGDCCAVGDGPGCADAGVQSCVCETAPDCCNTQWTDTCVALVEPLGCGICSGGGESTSCCDVHDTPSCDDLSIAQCVCAQDDFCCSVAWDVVCVGEVEQFGCWSCG